MSKRPTIKIVKRDERSRVAETPKTQATNDSPPEVTRKMVKTVTAWVREFKEKGDAEADKLMATLFEKTPRPTEA